MAQTLCMTRFCAISVALCHGNADGWITAPETVSFLPPGELKTDIGDMVPF